MIISGWTSLTHTAGRVAMCPARPADTASAPYPSIYQQPTVPSGVSASIVVPTVANRITRAFACRVGTFPFVSAPEYSDYPNGVGNVCRPRRTYDVALTTDVDAAIPVSSLRVMLTGSENTLTPNNLIRNRATRFTLRRANNSKICDTQFVTGMPNGGLTSSFDLKELPGSCSTTTFVQNELNGGRIVVDHEMELAVANLQQTLDITAAEVEINAVTGSASVVGPATSGWNSPSNALTTNASVATPQMPCGDFVCQVADPGRSRTPATPFTHLLQVGDFSFPGLFNSSNPDLDPSISTLRAVVKVVPSNAQLPAAWTALFGNFIDTENFLAPMRSYVELRTADGRGRCVTQGSGMNSDQEIAFDLLDVDVEDPTASNCNALVLANASDLSDLTLSIRFDMPCVPDWLHNVPFQCLRSNLLYDANDTTPVWQLRPPDIQHIRLTTVTDTYSGRPPTSTVTVDAGTGPSRATFNVAGSAWIPFGDLDIRWNGDATGAPLFGGDLVVHGLGSRMDSSGQMGVVCCSPPDARTVDLVAPIDGVERPIERKTPTSVSKLPGTRPTSLGGGRGAQLEVPDEGRQAFVLGSSSEQPALTRRTLTTPRTLGLPGLPDYPVG